MDNVTKLAKCKDASESLFNSLYDQLQTKSAQANESMYQAALSKARTKKQKEKCAGQYISSWQKLFNAWLANKVPNIYVMQYLEMEYIESFGYFDEVRLCV